MRLLQPFELHLEEVETLDIGRRSPALPPRAPLRDRRRSSARRITVTGDQLVHPGEAVEVVPVELARRRRAHRDEHALPRCDPSTGPSGTSARQAIASDPARMRGREIVARRPPGGDAVLPAVAVDIDGDVVGEELLRAVERGGLRRAGPACPRATGSERREHPVREPARRGWPASPGCVAAAVHDGLLVLSGSHRPRGDDARRSARPRLPRRATSTRSRPSHAAMAQSSSASAGATRRSRRSRLEVSRGDAEDALGAIGLQVHARHQPVAQQERQHVVAVRPLRGRRVDPDPVVEIEEPLGARRDPTPAGSKGESSARAATRRGALRPGIEIRRIVPALDRRGHELARLDQLGDAPARVGDGQAVVVAQVALGRHAEGARRVPEERALRLRPRTASAPRARSSGSTRSGRS